MNTYADKEQESISKAAQHNAEQTKGTMPGTLDTSSMQEQAVQEHEQPWMRGTHNPLQMRTSTQNPLQPRTSTQNPLKPMVSHQNPLNPLTTKQKSLQLLAKVFSAR
ncbi:MAG: hypothetical protein INR73_08695 [Williamsia sp.]|nr:hypothetical protein [Williamsia sp.]